MRLIHPPSRRRLVSSPSLRLVSSRGMRLRVCACDCTGYAMRLDGVCRATRRGGVCLRPYPVLHNVCTRYAPAPAPVPHTGHAPAPVPYTGYAPAPAPVPLATTLCPYPLLPHCARIPCYNTMRLHLHASTMLCTSTCVPCFHHTPAHHAVHLYLRASFPPHACLPPFHTFLQHLAGDGYRGWMWTGWM